MTRGLPAVVALALAAPVPARAQPSPEDAGPVRDVKLRVQGDRLTLSYDVDDLFDAATRARLTSGFTVRFVTRAYLYDAAQDEAADAFAATVAVRYDLWDEDFRVEVTGDGDPVAQRVRGIAALGEVLTAGAARPSFDRTRLRPGKPHQVAVIIEVDPLSDEQLSEVRRWLSRPPSGHRDLAMGGRSFFGSFVSLFVNVKVGQAARTLAFRSAPFRPGDLPAGGPS